jgi:hypothetical protein
MLSEMHPDYRLRQLVANVAGWADHLVGDVEDTRLLEAARFHLRQAGMLKTAVTYGTGASRVLGQQFRFRRG